MARSETCIAPSKNSVIPAEESSNVRYIIKERFFRLGEDSDILDESGRPVFHVDGKVFTLHDRLIVKDLSGQEVANVHRKLLAFRPTYEISVRGEKAAQVRKHLFTPFRDSFTIDVPGPDDLEMTGSLLDHDYTIRRGDQVVATVSKAWLTLRDTYGVETAPGEDDLLILAGVLALDLAEDRERGRDR
jgi:uncharacterized protein YxjI